MSVENLTVSEIKEQRQKAAHRAQGGGKKELAIIGILLLGLALYPLLPILILYVDGFEASLTNTCLFLMPTCSVITFAQAAGTITTRCICCFIYFCTLLWLQAGTFWGAIPVTSRWDITCSLR